MEEKSFFEILFDLSFKEFVTTRLIKVIFVIGVVASALSALMIIVGGFRIGFGRGLLRLVLSPVIFGLMVLWVRVACEMTIAVFRIAENTGRLADAQTPKAP